MKDYASLGKEILKIFNDHGYEAYFVGGYVRDFLLGIASKDIDIATSATPDQVASLFENTKETGLKFGTVTVIHHNFAFEVTTFRADGKYADSRHPVSVKFSQTLADDLVRRDFTINALAMDINGKIYDFCDGLSDLKNKQIRAVGDPNIRFKEDALRILRAFRFVAKLDFQIEENTWNQLVRNFDLLKNISIERIMQEIKAINGNPFSTKAFKLLEKANIITIFPDLAKGIALIGSLPSNPFNYYQFYALCFYLNGGEIADKWRFSNKERTVISQLIDIVSVTENDHFQVELVYAYGADMCRYANGILSVIRVGFDEDALIQDIDMKLPIHKVCDLKFKGQDIIAIAKINDASIIGEIISDLVLMVITNQLPNEYQALRTYALNRIANLDCKEVNHDQ
ncbi:MAG: CCA tRNA nucleotidyltransferase [Candidatus Izemoplasmatales bacterium]|jgi:tRNA nucleotidyltransferase (CCA-adding enzyme)|nr:CCA tRNA nucleotidyltransferase [Candidatus Izemoplasmatales bacterium]